MPSSPAISAISRDDTEVEMEPLDQPRGGYLAVPQNHPHPGRTSSALNSSRDVRVRTPLKRRGSWCWLFLLYLVILIVPWILTCILNYKPLNLSSYANTEPVALSTFDYDENALEAIRILNIVAALMTVPVLSLLLAYGAVTYTQRRTTSQRLSLQQTFALADRGWANLATLTRTLSPRNHKASTYLYLGSLLIFIGSVHQPLREVLVSPTTVYVSACPHPLSTGTCSSYEPPSGAVTAGYQPSLHYMQQMEQKYVLDALSGDLIVTDIRDPQPLLWNRNLLYRNTLQEYFGDLNDTSGSSSRNSENWIASVPNGTVTGILEEDTLRMNSSTSCAILDISAFPSTCPGDNPFVTSYNASNTQFGNTDEDDRLPFVVDVCAPGNVSASPWSINLNRQEVHEDLYIRISSSSRSSDGQLLANLTLHCNTNTTLGSFTLGNNQNGNQPSPIKDFDSNAQEPNVNMYGSTLPIPDRQPYDWPSPGPLTLLGISLFGPSSFFSRAINSTNGTVTSLDICNLNALPLQNLYTFHTSAPCDRVLFSHFTKDSWLPNLVWDWVDQLTSDSSTANQVMNAGVWLANKNMLMQSVTQQLQESLTDEVAIYTGSGYPITKPSVSLAGIIVVSVLLGAEVIGLCILALWIAQRPSWTSTLDAVAVARLARDVPEAEMVWPAIGDLQGNKGANGSAYVSELDKADGVVGWQERDRERVGDVSRLVLGGPGLCR